MSENKTILDTLEEKCRRAMMEKAALSCYYKELHDPVPRDVSKGQALAFAIAIGVKILAWLRYTLSCLAGILTVTRKHIMSCRINTFGVMKRYNGSRNSMRRGKG